jgi:hypothetical protein
LLVAPLVSVFACSAAGRDVIPESHDVHEAHVAAPSGAEGGYEHAARRPMGMVAIAESRGLDKQAAAQLIDKLADSLDACATRLASEGKLSPGAARVAARIDRDGSPSGLALTLTPGPGPTANALLCFVSPFKLLRFPAADVDPATRGLAVEAVWGSVTPAPSPAPPPP